MRRRVGAAAAVLFLAIYLFGGSAAALEDGPQISANWSGYVLPAGPFRAVKGEWVEPHVSCRRGQPRAVSFWVGLGGFFPKSSHLEQVGTESDCGPRGRIETYAWYELLPRFGKRLALNVVPGDRIAAGVRAAGETVILFVEDRSRHRAVHLSQRLRHPDLSSAEWIAESPSRCEQNRCTILPLANFKAVTFTADSAETASGLVVHPGSETAVPLVLVPGGEGAIVSAVAAPSPLGPDGTFTVRFR